MKRSSALFKSLYYHASLNHENMQGTGFCWLLRDLNRSNDLGIDEETFQKQREYFNTHPFLVNFVLGMWVKEYQENSKPDLMKKAYSSAFGALGDSFFGHSLRPLAFVLAALAGLYNPLIGVLVYLLFFNTFHLSFLLMGLDIGHSLGKEVITWFNRIKFNRWPVRFDMLSVFLLGFFISALFRTEVDVNVDLFFLGAGYVLLGIAIGKRVDIVLGLVINLMISGLIFFTMGV
ncbi:PTS system mannose/fructose/sorbose family transporter subunit IID [Limisalsivibrio acetivorans]|uniref:PTS system mannose/fructose/sorbose family transporter subunit IID n=1 Tax=Limisalsivibrio acetivorans TaxID=1304888 RepID=UPI000404B1AC|nr:PTS system mannose/fructose/sorbose family transporter subunit IID [Limisalsivibrio acetivorans]